MNGHYIRQIPPSHLAEMVRNHASCVENVQYWDQKDAPVAAGMRSLSSAWAKDEPLVQSAIALEQERVTSLAEFGRACEFFFAEEVEFDPAAVAKWKGQAHIGPMFDHFASFFSGKAVTTAAECESLLRGYQAQAGLDKLGPVVHPVRVALTGKTVGPGLFELMAVLGPERIVTRLGKAKEVLA
jgi:glutamyl-tRNA synthetase